MDGWMDGLTVPQVIRGKAAAESAEPDNLEEQDSIAFEGLLFGIWIGLRFH